MEKIKDLEPVGGRLVASDRLRISIGVAVMILALLAAYGRSFAVPFLFDDVSAIVTNSSIRQLWPLSPVLLLGEKRGLTVSGRPLVNLSLALNYAWSGSSPLSYHVVNLAIHCLASLLLFGIVRRTMRCPLLRERFCKAAFPLGLGMALLWALHPLQVESVTYVVQRAESLMGLCYFLSLYGLIRGIEGGKHARWGFGLAVAACFLGMACKEVMVTAPVILFLYDRTFWAGSFREALRRRGRVYLSVASAWILLFYLMASTGGRGGTAGFGLGIPWTAYALTQAKAVCIYLKLAFWPSPLIFDYGGNVLVAGMREVLMPLAVIAVSACGTVVALVRWPIVGFLLTWFLMILSPTSSVVPVADTIVEHRMYLPLASLAVLAGAVAFQILGRRSYALFLGLSMILGLLTARRNETYRSEESIWRDTIEKRPENARAHYTLGTILFQGGHADEAVAQYDEALRLIPNSVEAHIDLANALTRMGRVGDAMPHYETALRLKPNSADAHNNLANALMQLRRPVEAVSHYKEALRLKPDSADAHNNLGNVFAQSGRLVEAQAQYEDTLRLRPDFAEAHGNLGNVLAQSGRLKEALPHYEEALRLKPLAADIHFNLAATLIQLGDLPRAVLHYETVLKIAPSYPKARDILEKVRILQKQAEEQGRLPK